jgi:hypothetical protein
VQKLTPTATALEIYNTSWGNGRYYAPMHDTPANVVQYGSISPINVQPFLEKLFVGTTFPPLPSDTRHSRSDPPALQACDGGRYPGLRGSVDIRRGEDAGAKALHPTTGSPGCGLQVRISGMKLVIVPFGLRRRGH